jgi:adenosylhomocysteine nucleosidase
LVFDQSIGVVVGLAAEARIARRLGWPVAISGGTANGAQAAASHLIDEGVGALVSFGLAGGLDPALRPGTIIVPSQVILDGVSYSADRELMYRLGGPTPHVSFAAEQIAASAAIKGRLYETTGAAALDLESGAVARAASMRRLPFAVLRAICDPAERCLPSAALDALDARGVVAIWRVLLSLAAHPSQVPLLFRLAVDAAAARRSLARRVMQLARSPPGPRSLPGRDPCPDQARPVE